MHMETAIFCVYGIWLLVGYIIKLYKYLIEVSQTRDGGNKTKTNFHCPRHQMETFSAILALCAGNSPVIGELPITKASDAELLYFLWSAPE